MNPADLKAWRERMGWSQPVLADRLGVHPMTVSKWERGESEPPPFLPLALESLERGQN